MMCVGGAPCLLVADDSPVNEQKQKGKNNHVSPKSLVLMKLDDTLHLNKPQVPVFPSPLLF